MHQPEFRAEHRDSVRAREDQNCRAMSDLPGTRTFLGVHTDGVEYLCGSNRKD